jgi:hypothetical protein
LISFTWQGKVIADTGVHIIQGSTTQLKDWFLVWCQCRRIIGPTFFKNTRNSESYVEQIFFPFFEWLKEEQQHLYPFFQQYSAPAHMAKPSMDASRGMFGDNNS